VIRNLGFIRWAILTYTWDGQTWWLGRADLFGRETKLALLGDLRFQQSYYREPKMTVQPVARFAERTA
jgi:hypothetical protein